MGSYAYTCGISGLPIHPNDKVRFFLLSEGPYADDVAGDVYVYGKWFPRTFPLRGVYNDYGSVEKLEEGPAADMWMEGFAADLVEQGWGENTCHDVPTSRKMSLDKLLDALGEHRVRVIREADAFPHPKGDSHFNKRAVPKGVPTRKRVEARLKKAGVPLFAPADGPSTSAASTFAVDELQHGEVRIRREGYGADWGKDLDRLKEIRPLFKRYAKVIRPGHNGNDAEMILYPKPGTKDFFNGGFARKVQERKIKKTHLRVQQVMVREDVWQALCGLKITSWHEEKDVASYRQTAREMFDQLREALLATYDHKWGLPCAVSMLRSHEWESVAAMQSLLGGKVPFAVGLDTHFRLMAQKPDLTEEQIQDFTNTAGEMVFLENLLHTQRIQWHPSASCGPQYSMFRDHVTFLQTLVKIAKAEAAEQKKDRC